MRLLLKHNKYLIILVVMLLFASLACVDLAELPVEQGGVQQQPDVSPGEGSQGALPTLAPLPEDGALEEHDDSEIASDLEGITVEVNDVNWTLLETAELGDTLESESDTVDDLVADGRLVGVRVAIENLGEEAVTYTGLTIVDDQEQSYTYISEALPFIIDDEACEVEELAPETTIVCTIIFDVPDDATGLQAVFTDMSFFGGSQELVDLELE